MKNCDFKQDNYLSNHNDKDPKSLSNTQVNPQIDNEMKISYFLSPIQNTLPYKHITLGDVAMAIKSGKAKGATQSLRAIADIDKARQYKANSFDYATFSGTFSQRKANALMEYSGLMALDFDDVNVAYVKKRLLSQTDVDTVMLFTSPSGHGVKWVVPSTTKEEHKQVFRMYQRYCKDKFDLEVDESGKDIARACFIPYDDEVVLNEEFAFRMQPKYWNNTQSENTKQGKRGQSDGTSPFDEYNNRGDVVSLLEAHGWRKYETKSDTINFTRPGKKSGVSANFRLSDKILYVFTGSSIFEGSKAYNPSQVFATLECGGDYKLGRKKLLKMGYGEKSTRSNSEDNTLDTDKANEAFDFYTPDFKISASRLAEFYKRRGFMRLSEEGIDSISIIKNSNKILKPFNYKTDTIAFLKKHINHPEKKAEIENELVNKRVIVENSWKLMDGQPYNLHKDTKNAIYIPFKNGVCKVTKEGTEMVDYKSKEIAFFIDNIESQKHYFEMTNMAKRGIGDFERFLIYAIVGRETDDITQYEMNDIRAFYSMIGYLISNYKDPAESPAVILTDKDTDDEARRGGRGKTLLTDAIRTVRGNKIRGGTEFDTGYRHVFGDLEKHHDIYILDDVPARFNYDALYTNITGDITAEGKGTKAVTIPFKDAPKFVVSTNWVVKYDKDADSTNRRFVEYKFSYFWNNQHKPVSFFGHRFFDEWDEGEWQLFFEFIVACTTQYLTTGLQRISYSKDEDNYRIYFSNDIVLEEFERIFEAMREKGAFNGSLFLGEYRGKSPLRNEKFFHKNNIRKMIVAYVDKHNIDISYEKKSKWWTFPNVDNENKPDAKQGSLEIPF